MGLVGINESGKTNVLRGLSVLSGLHTLSLSDRPKNFKLRYPHISFVFELTANETIGVSDIYKAKGIPAELWPTRLEVELHVKFENDSEERFFTLNNIKPIRGMRYLQQEDLQRIFPESLSLGENTLVVKQEKIDKWKKNISASKKYLSLIHI